MWGNCAKHLPSASTSWLQLLDAVYHRALRFITGCTALTHHCTLYAPVKWSSSSTRRTLHRYNFLYKSILGLLPSYPSLHVQSLPSLPRLHHCQCSLSPYRALQKGIFSLSLEHTTAGSEVVQLDPTRGFQTYSKVTGKSYGTLFLVLVLIIFDLLPLGTLCNCVLYCL